MFKYLLRIATTAQIMFAASEKNGLWKTFVAKYFIENNFTHEPANEGKKGTKTRNQKIANPIW